MLELNIFRIIQFVDSGTIITIPSIHKAMSPWILNNEQIVFVFSIDTCMC